MGPDLFQPEQVGSCRVCGLPECRTDHYTFDGRPAVRVGRVWEVPANVYRDGRLAFAVGDVLDYDEAVREGLVEHTELPAEPPKGKRKGSGGRARRPQEDRARRLQEDRDAGQ